MSNNDNKPKDPKTEVLELLKKLGIGESDVPNEDLLLTQMTIIGLNEMMHLLNEGIRKELLYSARKVNTNVIRLYSSGMASYAMMMEKMLNEYDALLAERKTVPLDGTENLDRREVHDDLAEIFKNFKKGSRGGNGNDPIN